MSVILCSKVDLRLRKVRLGQFFLGNRILLTGEFLLKKKIVKDWKWSGPFDMDSSKVTVH